MAEAIDGVRKWAATVSAALTVALVIGGMNLQGNVTTIASELKATAVLAQATDAAKQRLDSAVSGIEQNLEGLRRDVDKIGDAIEKQAAEQAKDRALILQELGRLQGVVDTQAGRRQGD